MSSFYDDASLIIVPSGYKTSKIYAEKPTDGSGDLTFTRASGATRVGSDGLIEKVRTNLVLYSQDASNAIWSKTGCTVTADFATAPDGTQTADKLVFGASGNEIIQALSGLTSGAEYTFSFYAKTESGTYDFTFGNVSFSLTSATATTSWQRFTVTQSATATTRYPKITATSAGALIVWGFQVESGVATDYIPTTTAAVSVGPVSNVPRLDYLGSSCPRLLLEPQRTNLVTYSEQLNNAAWTKDKVTVTANATTAPDGTISADKVVDTLQGNTAYRIYNSLTLSAITYSASFYVKAAEYNWVYIRIGNALRVWFNVSTGVVGSADSGISGRIEAAGNGWYRCTAIITTATAGGGFALLGLTTANGLEAYTPSTGGQGVFVWGAQLEAGSYATSYIPTLAASVTRVGELVDKNGIASLIGGTSGTVFFEIKTNTTLTNANYKQFFYYKDSSTGQAYLYLSPTNNVRTSPTLGNITSSITLAANTVYKVAIAYANNDFKLYINGVERGSSTSGTPIDAVNILSIGSLLGTSEFNEMTFSKYLHFKSRLTNAQLAELTTL